jgi:hypothetical protein
VSFSRDAWIADEPRFLVALRDVCARAARRPLRAIGAAVLVTFLLMVARLASPPAYVATVTFRVAEGDVHDPANAPRLPASLREHVSNIALNRTYLLGLMERHRLSPRLRVANPVAAVDSLREDIEIEVARNYFIFERGDEPRSAQVVISFTGGDRDVAWAVVHDVGAVVLETQAATRRRWVEQARQASEREAQGARERLRALQKRGAATRAEADRYPLERELLRASERVEKLDARVAELEVSHDVEQQDLGLSFQLVDESVRTVRRPAEGWRIAAEAVLLLVVLLPISTALVGALDQRIYRGADVIARGFPLLGTVPHLDTR